MLSNGATKKIHIIFNVYAKVDNMLFLLKYCGKWGWIC